MKSKPSTFFFFHNTHSPWTFWRPITIYICFWRVKNSRLCVCVCMDIYVCVYIFKHIDGIQNMMLWKTMTSTKVSCRDRFWESVSSVIPPSRWETSRHKHGGINTHTRWPQLQVSNRIIWVSSSPHAQCCSAFLPVCKPGPSFATACPLGPAGRLTTSPPLPPAKLTRYKPCWLLNCRKRLRLMHIKGCSSIGLQH